MSSLRQPLVFVLALFLWASSQTSQQTGEKCVVQGVVVDSKSGAPLRKATVLLNRSGEAPMSATTNAEGRFTIEGIPPGTYDLDAQRDGYLPKMWMDAESGGRYIVLEPGQRRTDVVIKLTRQGVVYGKVFDADGDPVTDAWVYAADFSRRKQSSDFGAPHQKETNDLGEYRIYGLYPGRYAVCVKRRMQVVEFSRGAGTQTRDRSPQEVYLPTCFPNVTDIANASPVEVSAGEEVRVDLVLVRGEVFTVRGRIHVPAAASKKEVRVWLSTPAGSDAVSSEFYDAVARAPEFTFEIRNVRPSSYQLQARAETEKKSFEAKRPLEVGYGNVEGLELTLVPGAELSGKVQFLVGDLKSIKFARVELHGDELYGRPGEMGELRADGTFRFDNLWTGEYLVSFYTQDEQEKGAGYYVKSSSLGGQTLRENRIQIAAGGIYSGMEIWVSRSSALVEGAVTLNGRPVYAATVILTTASATGNSKRSAHSLFARTDDNGQFHIERPAPGKYHLIAFEEGNDLMGMDEKQFWELVEKKGVSVSIEENSKIRLDVTAVPRKATKDNP